MFNRLQVFLGPQRLQSLFLLFVVTGLLSLILNGVEADWVVGVQTALVLIFLIGAGILIGGRMDSYDRGRWAAILFPVVIAILIGVFVFPESLLLIMGMSFGWIVAGLFIFRARGPMEYQQAVKSLRKSEYADAVKAMDGLIKEEPDRPNHYRFRAEILRLWGKLDRARRDYEQMAKIDSQSAVAYNGLAEVNLQAGRFEAAQEAAYKAYELAPDEWVAAYNLGMIEDRLSEAALAVEHLQQALALKVPDIRHRLLIHFYLVRAYHRLGDESSASEQIEMLKKNRSGLGQWQVILENPQAQTLRAVLQADVDTIEHLLNEEMTIAELQ
ncbi:MAG: hypothetical protein RLP44_13730 [Aggregatilineales bacterium]